MAKAFLIFAFILISSCHATDILSNQVFTFTPSSFLRMHPSWPTMEPWKIKFAFKTLDPQGVLLYFGAPNDELYVMLENGRLLITQPFSTINKPVYIGMGLNEDAWHEIEIQLDSRSKTLVIKLDSLEESLPLLIKQLPTSVLYLGGLDLDDLTWSQQFNYIPFTGCLGNLSVQYLDRPLNILQADISPNIREKCIDQCKRKNKDICKNEGRCINYYSHMVCDCFGTNYEGKYCDKRAKWYYGDTTALTFYGNSYLSYRMYDWNDKAHSNKNLFSLTFKTVIPNSLLLHSFSETQHLTLILIKGALKFEMNFGEENYFSFIGSELNDDKWHNITIVHEEKYIYLFLDSMVTKNIEIVGENYQLFLDPNLYIGGTPQQTKGVQEESRKYMGCLRDLYYNHWNILAHLSTPSTSFHSPLPLKYGCAQVDKVPITFPWPESYLALQYQNKLELSFNFLTLNGSGVLASGSLTLNQNHGFWQVELIKEVPTFHMHLDNLHIDWNLKMNAPITFNTWHHLYLILTEKTVIFQVDSQRVTYNATEKVKLTHHVVIGTKVNKTSSGFTGCIHSISVGEFQFDARKLEDYEHNSLTLDMCEYINPCSNPSVCEHGATCSFIEGKTFCNCSDTGYAGKTCRFSTNKKSCKDLYLIGYEVSGEYTIDIDKNGPLPPSSVYCKMGTNVITRVDNNLYNETIRVKDFEGFSFNITYRDFSPEMLKLLIKQSTHCSQEITYDCIGAKLGLGTNFWLRSVNSYRFLDSFGTRTPKHCECADTNFCSNVSLTCNCDNGAFKSQNDKGTFYQPTDVALTEIFALPPTGMTSESVGKISLGPLECKDTDTLKYVITYKTAHSFLEVPSWRSGELAFSFRTSNSSAILLYQTGYRGEHSYFRILLTSDHEVSFEFTVDQNPYSVKLLSHRKLNTGLWNQVWVNYDKHHMHFTVNLDSEMIEFNEEEDVGPFEGPMYLGGVPKAYSGSSRVKEGFIGCFRGLVMNNEFVNLYKYLTNRSVDIAKDCRPSCSPNPCQNGATCHEHWGSYTCVCVNPVAHAGKNCQHNINANGMTFLTPNSYFHNASTEKQTDPLLTDNFLLSFRTYEEQALLLYVFDQNNNFAQLHLVDSKTIILTYNHLRKIHQINVTVPGITRGKPVQIQVERGATGVLLSVEDSSAFSKVSVGILIDYHQDPWQEGNDLETVHPPRGTFPTLEHSELFLGGLGSGTFSKIPGLVGCLQGLQIGDKVFDLNKAASDRKFSHGALVSDCKMLCDRLPCHHNGICIEDWRENVTSCDCTFTSYTGSNCQKDIGNHFDGKTYIAYSLDSSVHDIHTIKLKVAFSTENEIDQKQLLMFVQMGTSYILLALQPKGVLVIEDSTHEDVFLTQIKRESTLDDGFRHWLQYSRINSEVRIELDEKEYFPVKTSNPTFLIENTNHVLHVGGIDFEPLKNHFNHYEGCISNLEIEVESQTIKPLEIIFSPAFKEKKDSKVTLVGEVKEKPCAQFAEVTFRETEQQVLLPEFHETKWLPLPPKMFLYAPPKMSKEAAYLQSVKEDSVFIGIIVGALLLAVFICVAIYLWYLEAKHRNKKSKSSIAYLEIRDEKKPKGESLGYIDVKQPPSSNLFAKASTRRQDSFQDLEYNSGEATRLMGQTTPQRENRRNESAQSGQPSKKKDPARSSVKKVAPPLPPKKKSQQIYLP